MTDQEIVAEFKAQSKMKRELLVVCQKFVKDQRIYSADCVYQTDRVIENAYEFITDVCDIVGYYEEEE